MMMDWTGRLDNCGLAWRGLDWPGVDWTGCLAVGLQYQPRSACNHLIWRILHNQVTTNLSSYHLMELVAAIKPL
jgi:hypothetical protein